MGVFRALQSKLKSIQPQLDLDEHMSARHSADGLPKLPCDVCGKRFFSVSRLQYHRSDQHEAKPEEKGPRTYDVSRTLWHFLDPLSIYLLTASA